MTVLGARSSAGVVGLLLLLTGCITAARLPVSGRYDAVHSGTPWFDQRGLPVSAHGAGIIRVADTWYLFGEAHRDMSNAFSGFNCYSSKDLVNWRFESVALPVQPTGPLGPDTVGERPKVMRSPATGEFVMLMHADALDYRGQFVGYATSPTVTGPFTFRGPLLFNGQPIKKWDLGAFQDRDGAGYLLLHGGEIFRLSDDYRSVIAKVNDALAHGFESPALFRKGDTYYFLGSNLTGWARNDNYYYTAHSLSGPWTQQGLIAPKGTLTWNSQTTFVLPVQGTKETTYVFMGDRWSHPRQASAATYVWQPLKVDGGKLSLPTFYDSWRLDITSGQARPAPVAGEVITADDPRVRFSGVWQSGADQGVTYRTASDTGASVDVSFRGTQATLYAVARQEGGYARITLRDAHGEALLSSTVDMYSQYPARSVRFVTPLLPHGTYTISMMVVGEGWESFNKAGERSGSSGHAITFESLLVRR